MANLWWANSAAWQVESDLLDLREMTRRARTIPAETGSFYRPSTPPTDESVPNNLGPQEKLAWILRACDKLDFQLKSVAEFKKETGWARPRGWRPGDYEPSWSARDQAKLSGDLELVQLVRQTATDLQAKLTELGV